MKKSNSQRVNSPPSPPRSEGEGQGEVALRAQGREASGPDSKISKTRSFLKYWLLPLAWMSLIFFGSSDAKSYTHSSRLIEPLLHWLFPHMSQPHIEAIHHVIRKCAHLTEYAILATLLWRAVRKPVRRDPRPWSWREAAIAILIVFLYASTDEFHQMFVPTRTPMVSDVFIDTSGAVIGMIVLWTLGRWFSWWPKRISGER